MNRIEARRLMTFTGATLLGVALLPGCDQEVDPPDNEIKTVEVVYNDGTPVVVDLADLEAVTLDDGEEYARLSDVVEAAGLGVALADLQFDFEGSDGFRSSSTSTCTETIPMAGELLSQGYIHRVTRNLAWDEAADMPGCVHVDDTARLLASDAAAAGPTVDVTYNGDTVTVDLSEAEGDVAGTASLADVIAAADLGVAVEALAFDFVASDGFRVSEAGNCAPFFPIAGDQLGAGAIEIATRNLSWDEAAGLPGCANVDDLATIEVTDLSTGPFVDVTYGGDTFTVDLSEAEVVDFEGSDAVGLAEVVALADLGVAAADLTFDFVASDGFRVSEAANCAATFPIAGDQLDAGYVLLENQNLVWDAAADMPGCAFADDLATIDAIDP
jgi:hypothetical protein